MKIAQRQLKTFLKCSRNTVRADGDWGGPTSNNNSDHNGYCEHLLRGSHFVKSFMHMIPGGRTQPCR